MTTTLDQQVDKLVEELRAQPGVTQAAGVLSTIGDYGAIWTLIAAHKLTKPGHRVRTFFALGLSGFGSLAVKTVIKSLVKRERPQPDEERAEVLARAPTSSSFPSGHTLAAFAAAVALAETPAETVAYVAIASAVGASRLVLRDHHPTDVIAGAGIGLGIGVAVRKALKWGMALGR